MYKLIHLILIILVLGISFLQAGITGKIVGTVIDRVTGDALIGVNIELLQTVLGGSSDEEGFFMIINIPPGKYTLRASYIGYTNIEITDVIVTVDQTTEIEIAMSESALEMSETITIVADRDLIRKDVTSKRSVIDGSAIADELPVSTINDVLALQAGVTSDEDGNIHIRGGRLGEVAYLVDGTYVRDPFDNSLGGNVDIEAIQEMEVISGTFNAEYGNALSGIVNVVTKEGTPDVKFKFQYESPMLNSSPYHKADWLLETDLVKGLDVEQKQEYLDVVRDENGNSVYKHVGVLDSKYAPDKTVLGVLGKFNSSLSGPIPYIKNANFFVAGTFRNEDSYLPYGFSLDRDISAKLSYRPITSINVQANIDWSSRWYQPYNHQYKYWQYMEKTNQGSYPILSDFKNRYTLKMTHTLSSSTFYTLSLSRIYNQAKREIEERNVLYNKETGALISSDYLTRGYYQGAEGNFQIGDDRYWSRTHSTTFDVDLDFVSQINRYHQLKSGIEFRQHNIFRHRIGMPPRSNIEFFEEKPYEAAIYIQDKIELSYLVMNVGLRFDYFNPKSNYFEDPGKIIQITTDQTGQSIITTVPPQKAPARYHFSPRIGLAHPITETTVFHFAYGHFFQVPRLYDLYLNNDLEDILANDALVGNPGLEPEETVAFEAGFKQQVGLDYAVDVSAYYKDISNLISSFYYFSGRDYTTYINADYGRVQGVDVTLTKRPSNYFSGALNYSFMIAKGNESDPSEGYLQYREEDAYLKPNRNYYLDFDRRHTFSLNVGLHFPAMFGPEILKLHPFSNINASVLITAASGLPYTPTSRDPDASVLPEKNSARKGSTKQIDLRINKRIKFWKIDLDVYTRIENLFDNINVKRVWTATGDPWDQGPTSNYSKDRQANPDNVDIRRQVRAGIIIRL